MCDIDWWSSICWNFTSSFQNLLEVLGYLTGSEAQKSDRPKRRKQEVKHRTRVDDMPPGVVPAPTWTIQGWSCRRKRCAAHAAVEGQCMASGTATGQTHAKDGNRPETWTSPFGQVTQVYKAGPRQGLKELSWETGPSGRKMAARSGLKMEAHRLYWAYVGPM